MDYQDVIAQARDAITMKRVFGEPYERNGLTLIPAAKVQGCAGQSCRTEHQLSFGDQVPLHMGGRSRPSCRD